MPDLLGRPLPGETIRSAGGGVDLLGRPLPGGGESQGILGSTLTTIAPVLDFLSRGQYASAGFFDAMINDDASIGDALSLAVNELVSPTKKRSFSDVITRANPDFASNNPIATKVLGTFFDIAADPTTYIGFGLGATTKGARIGGRALTSVGETMQQAAREALTGRSFAIGLTNIPGRRLLPGGSLNVEIAHPGQLQKARTLAKESLTRLPREVGENINIGVGRAAGAEFALVPTAENTKKYINVIKHVFGNKLPKGVTDKDILDLAGRISLERLGSRDVAEAVEFIRRPLSEIEIIDSADRMISRLVSEFPQLDREVFKPGALKLLVGVPFTPLQKEVPLITTNMLRAVGLDKLDSFMKLVAKLPAIKQAVNAGKVIRGAFDRFYEVDPRYIDEVIKPFENERSFVAAQVLTDADRLLKTFDLDKEARERVSKVMNAFDAGISALPVGHIRNALIERTGTTFAAEIFQAALRQAPLKPKEQALVMSLMEGYMRAAELEQAAHVVGQSAANFDPRVYKAIAQRGEDAVEWIKRNRPDGSVDVEGFSDLKLLEDATDIARAIREGANLDQDAILLYASRLMKARMALPKRQAEGALRAIYGTADPEELAKMGHKKVADDWRYFGKMDVPGFRTEEANAILNTIDNIQRLWKGSKTILNPGFGPKQFVQNSFQAALALGNNAFRTFDPRTFKAAALRTFGSNPVRRTGLPSAADRWLRVFATKEEYAAAKELAVENLNKNVFSQKFGNDVIFTTPFGKKYTASELGLLENQLGIARGVTGVSGETVNKLLFKELGTGRATSMPGKAKEGFLRLLRGYAGWAAKFEDTSRRALFYNGLMLGDTPQQAAQRVNRALFDYQRAHSEFEIEVMRRLAPFYSYTRFALPFALKQAIQNPGSITATNKVLELFSDIYSSDDQGGPRTLSREQLEMFMPNFLLDQPRFFWGWDPEGNPEFSTFQGMTPFDILSTFTLQDKHGRIDWRASAEKSIGGLLTPILKIPAELAANKEFFTQRVIDEAGGGRGRLRDVKDSNLDSILPESIKEAIGWEWARDRRTGKDVAYVNPYMAYTMAQLAPPVFRQFINLPDLSGGSIMELAMKQALGIGDPDIDIRQSLEIQSKQDRAYLQDLKQRIRTLRRQGRLDEAGEARLDYVKVLQAVAEKRRTLGAAIEQLGPPVQEQEEQ